MPRISFNTVEEDNIPNTTTQQTSENEMPDNDEYALFDEYNNNEQKDTPYYITEPNSIQVEFGNGPFAILFGPPNCGKTMTLIRLSRYLRDCGFRMNANRTFRNASDTNYEQLRNNFPDYLNNPQGLAARGTALLDFVLVDVIDNKGNRVLKILEAPGEHYFDPTNPNNQSEFPRYITELINDSKNSKIWIIVLEPNWGTTEKRRAYVDRIKSLSRRLPNSRSRKVVILYNKIDKTELEKSVSVANRRALMEEIDVQYPGLRKIFKNEIPIIQLFKPYYCEFVPFSTGTFLKTENGLAYVPSSNSYPKQLWNVLKRLIGIR